MAQPQDGDNICSKVSRLLEEVGGQRRELREGKQYQRHITPYIRPMGFKSFVVVGSSDYHHTLSNQKHLDPLPVFFITKGCASLLV